MSKKDLTPLPSKPKTSENKDQIIEQPVGEDGISDLPSYPSQRDETDSELLEAVKNAKDMIENLNAENDQLKRELDAKTKEIEEMHAAFNKIKTNLDTINLKFEQNEIQISNLNETIKMKDEQIKLLQDTQNMKNEQIKMKDEQIFSLKKELEDLKTEHGALKLEFETREEQINKELIGSIEQKLHAIEAENNRIQTELNTATLENSKLSEELKKKEKLVSELTEDLQKLKKEYKQMQEEMKLTRLDLDAADAEIEKLMKQIEESKSKVKLNITKKFTEVEEIMKQIMQSAQHKITIIAPTIKDLQNLDIYSIKPNVQISVATNYDPLKKEHNTLLEEYKSIENIQIKMYDLGDRYGVLKDGDRLFVAMMSKKPDECMIIDTSDELQIKSLTSLINDVWLRARKV